jgi:tellurite resistance protein
MGLFDKVLGNQDAAKLTEAEGMAGVALCAVAADGAITEEEAADLGTSLSRMSLFSGMGSHEVNKIFDKLIQVVHRHGVDALLQMSSVAVTPSLKPTAFAIATDLLMADGSISPEEKAFLERIQVALTVPEDLAVKIVEVIAIKNRG